jgi:hypothetical protein
MFRQASRQKPGAEAPRLPEALAAATIATTAPTATTPSTASFAGEASFGTMQGGDHTANELLDLLKAKKSEIDDVTNHVGSLPANSDPTWRAWIADWHTFLSDWERVRSSGQGFIDAVIANPTLTQAGALLSSPLAFFTQKDPLDMADAEAYYQAVLGVLMPQGVGTSRLQDLYRRYTALPSATPVKFRPTPQPKAPDEQLQMYQKLPDLSLPKHGVPWWVWAAGGTLVLGAGVTVLKASPLGMVLQVLR